MFCDLFSSTQVSPTGRTNRRALKQVESEGHCDGEHQASPASSVKRCSRASRLHSPEQPATPPGSSHDTDVSDVESLCSAVSDTQTPLTRSKRQAKRSRRDEELSEVESCSSVVSASSAGWSTRRSSRRKALPPRSDAVRGAVEMDSVQDSCGSTVSTPSRVTSRQRKPSTRSSTKQSGDSEFSEHDSYLSSISGADVPKSTTRRAARSRTQTGPIPINMDKAGDDAPLTPVRQSSRVAARKKTLAAAEASEPQSCDSEGFESGPSYSRQSRQRRVVKIQDSDSDLTDFQSPDDSSGSKPSSSRTSSRNKFPDTPNVPRQSVKSVTVVEKSVESAEDTPLDDSRLENTVVAEDADCTLVEEEIRQDPKSDEAGTIGETKVSAQDSQSVEYAAAVVRCQQEELCVEIQKGGTLELEEMQEKAATEPPELEICETKEQDVAARDTDADQLQGGEDEDAAVDPQLCEEEEEMEVGPVDGGDQQVVKCFQVSSSQGHNVKVDPVPEEEPEVITIWKKELISLLDSSEDDEEDDDEEERDVSDAEETRGVPSPKPGAAGMVIDGLFMIDTRPGQEADEQYYLGKAVEKKEPTEDEAEQEEEEDFVDEEGNDEDDEGADVLYSSRNPLL